MRKSHTQEVRMNPLTPEPIVLETISEEPENSLLQGPRPSFVSRPSFRDHVRAYLRASGIQGAPRTEVLVYFRAYPATKVTIALNELLTRREAYLRNGIYRLTARVEPGDDKPI